jgi:FkbM family methyltransferase
MTIPMARAVGPRGTIHALELQPYFVRLLQANLALNGIHQVFVRNVAAARAAGLMRLPPIPYDRPANFSGISFAGLPTDGSGSGFPVSVRPLDAMFRDLKRLQLLKMDIEMMEPAALAGAAELIARLRPIVYCETRSAAVFDAVRAQLAGAGYRLYWHAFRGYSATNYRGNPANRFGAQGDVNLLAMPPDFGEPVPGLVPARDFSEVEQHWPGILGPSAAGASG